MTTDNNSIKQGSTVMLRGQTSLQMTVEYIDGTKAKVIWAADKHIRRDTIALDALEVISGRGLYS